MNRRDLSIRGPVSALLISVGLLCGLGVSSSARAQGTTQGVTPTEIKIGWTGGLTGVSALPAQGVKAALEAAIAEVNDKGGIHGRKLTLVAFDDGFDIQRSVANMRRLIDNEKVFSVVGAAGSPNLPASWPFVKNKGIPIFGPTLPPDPKLPSVFMLGTGHFDQARSIADFIASKGAKTVAIFKQDTDLGKAIGDGVKQQAGRSGLQVVADVTTEVQGNDVSSAVLLVRKANPDAVVFGTDPTQTALIMQGMDKLGWKPAISIGDSSTISTGSAATVKPAGKGAIGAYGTLIAEPPTSDAQGVKAWRAAMQKYRPDFTKSEFGAGLLTYAGAQVFFEVLRRVGPDLSWASFITTAESMKDFETHSWPKVSFAKDYETGGHLGTRGVTVQQWDGTAWNRVIEGFIEPK